MVQTETRSRYIVPESRVGSQTYFTSRLMEQKGMEMPPNSVWSSPRARSGGEGTWIEEQAFIVEPLVFPFHPDL